MPGLANPRRVAIGRGDPIGPPEDRVAVLREFARSSEMSGLVPCVFSASDATAREARALAAGGDVMRRRDDGAFRPVVEFLIASSCPAPRCGSCCSSSDPADRRSGNRSG
ncbi:hypothetical protein [Pseudonocardia sp. T1-2H]|uniref:hypothetical protein n=1 Tax=Pseudonocardia sp. T1-2H TaxID=3128899 RepID=UPI0031011475